MHHKWVSWVEGVYFYLIYFVLVWLNYKLVSLDICLNFNRPFFISGVSYSSVDAIDKT